MTLRRRSTILACLALILGLTFSWLFGNASTGRTAVPQRATPPGAQEIILRAADGISLASTFWPAAENAPGILLLHGLGSSRVQFDEEGEALSRRGYAVLAINFRAHGESGGDVRSFGLFEARDAHAAFAWLKRKQHGAKMGVVGLSLGGAAALLGPAGPLQADAFVLNAVYPDIRHAIRNRIASVTGKPLAYLGEPLLTYQAPLRFGVWPDQLSPIKAISKVRAPVLVIGGELDVFTPPNETRAIYQAASGPKQLWIVPNADHNQTTRGNGYMSRMIAFFDATLKT